MRWKRVAIIYFSVVALLQLGDFAGNVFTLLDGELLLRTATTLGISREGELGRLAILLPFTLAIALIYALVSWGFWRDTHWQYRYYIAAITAFAYALFHQITFFTVPDSPGSIFIAIFYFALAVVSLWVGRKALTETKI